MARATKAERELERALFPMRRELRVLESRLHGLKARESRIGTKRAREGEGEDLAQAAPKRLRSEVVAPTPSAPAPAPVRPRSPRLLSRSLEDEYVYDSFANLLVLRAIQGQACLHGYLHEGT